MRNEVTIYNYYEQIEDIFSDISMNPVSIIEIQNDYTINEKFCTAFEILAKLIDVSDIENVEVLYNTLLHKFKLKIIIGTEDENKKLVYRELSKMYYHTIQNILSKEIRNPNSKRKSKINKYHNVPYQFLKDIKSTDELIDGVERTVYDYMIYMSYISMELSSEDKTYDNKSIIESKNKMLSWLKDKKPKNIKKSSIHSILDNTASENIKIIRDVDDMLHNIYSDAETGKDTSEFLNLLYNKDKFNSRIKKIIDEKLYLYIDPMTMKNIKEVL